MQAVARPHATPMSAASGCSRGDPAVIADSEYASRWRALAAQLQQLEREAGILNSASRLRDATPSSPGPHHEPGDDRNHNGHAAPPDPVPLDTFQRRELRAAYFGVPN